MASTPLLPVQASDDASLSAASPPMMAEVDKEHVLDRTSQRVPEESNKSLLRPVLIKFRNFPTDLFADQAKNIPRFLAHSFEHR